MSYEEVMNLSARRGLFFPTAEIYANSPAGFFEFGPEGTKIRNKLIQFWRNELVEKEQALEIFGSIILPESVWKASGHLDNFNDPIVLGSDGTPYRADKLIEEKLEYEIPEGAPLKFFEEKIKEFSIADPKTKKPLGKVQRFNLMMRVDLGAKGELQGYLRGEACQNIFLNFPRIWKSGRVNLPFGMATVGESFRNEIAPRQGLIRKRELTHMDLEIFFNPKKINEMPGFEKIKNYKLQLYLLKDKKIHPTSCQEAVEQKMVSGKLIAYYLARTQQFFEKIGIPAEKIRFRELEEDARAFYAAETWDCEAELSTGWLELAACNYRTDYDLKTHSQHSGQDLQVKEEGENEKFFPHVFEISMGLDRVFLSVIELSYKKEQRGKEERVFLDLPKGISPAMVGVFPLVKKDGLLEKAKEIYENIRKNKFDAVLDAKGSIGKRYARIDEIGVPYAITIDYQTMKDQTITLRERTSMKQKRIPIETLEEILWKFSTGHKKFEDLAE
jgi:glycyl-tRNA synthetase